MMAQHLAVVGTQWGDEGKGKIVDALSPDFDIVVRYQGGTNAGHTVVAGGKQTILHLIPSGILHEEATCIIGNGTVLDPAVLTEELDTVKVAGCTAEGRLFISDSAHIIMPYHRILDKAQETFRGKKRLGTTGRGIGPCYADKAHRSTALRVGDLAYPDEFREKVAQICQRKNTVFAALYDAEPLDGARSAAAYL